MRNVLLDNGSFPLGISFRSKTEYGRCWAFWDRRADDGLTPGDNDPASAGSTNIDTDAFRQVAADFRLPILPGRPRH